MPPARAPHKSASTASHLSSTQPPLHRSAYLPITTSLLCPALPCCAVLCCPQLREERKSERRASGSVWVGDSQVLREAVRETEWSLGDASSTELPVEAGRRAEGDYLQMSGDRL